MENKKKNIYEKINWVQLKIVDAKIKKSGKNNFVIFDYYELSDFVPTIIKLCEEIGLARIFNASQNEMSLTLVNTDNIEEKIIYNIPFVDFEIRGANPQQVMGGKITYNRRYLYMMAFDIVEPDQFDATAGAKEYTKKENVNNNSLFKQNISYEDLKQKIMNCKTWNEILEINKEFRCDRKTKEEVIELDNILKNKKEEFGINK